MEKWKHERTWYKNMKNKMNCELMLTYDTPAYIYILNASICYKILCGKYFSSKLRILTFNEPLAVLNRQVQKRFPQYGIPIWSLWPNIRFLPSIVAEKNLTKNILNGRKDGRTEGRTDRRTDGQKDGQKDGRKDELCMSFCPFVRLSVRPSICLSVRPSVHPSVRPSVHPSIQDSRQLKVMCRDRKFSQCNRSLMDHSSWAYRSL
jgi:hypothetical protein